MTDALIVRNGYLAELERWRGAPVVKVLSGLRRVGKSVLLRQWKERLETLHQLPSGAIWLMERDSLDWLHLESWEQLRDVVGPWVDEVAGPKALLIDEVQLIDGWEKVVNALHKRGDVDIYLTGSNARLLSSDLSTLLSGRWARDKASSRPRPRARASTNCRSAAAIFPSKSFRCAKRIFAVIGCG